MFWKLEILRRWKKSSGMREINYISCASAHHLRKIKNHVDGEKGVGENRVKGYAHERQLPATWGWCGLGAIGCEQWAGVTLGGANGAHSR